MENREDIPSGAALISSVLNFKIPQGHGTFRISLRKRFRPLKLPAVMPTRPLIFALLFALALPIFAQTAPPDAQAAPEGMALIPGGDGWMGTDETDGTDNNQRDNVPLHANDARPRHRVTVAPFYMDKTLVTCAQYKLFCDATKIPVPPDWNDGKIPLGRENCPVFHINWYEASAYANWAGKRLPTETEWERAARGDEDREYPWGAGFDESKIAWNLDKPLPVGSRPSGATPQGLLDMAGNGYEWTSSWFEAYPGAPVKVPEFGRSLKVARGGGWRGDGGRLTRNWQRGVNRPISRLEWLGFRCAKDVAP